VWNWAQNATLVRAGAVIAHIKRWHAEVQPHMHYPAILRCPGASESWLSPSYQQESCFFGFVIYYAEDGSLSLNKLWWNAVS